MGETWVAEAMAHLPKSCFNLLTPPLGTVPNTLLPPTPPPEGVVLKGDEIPVSWTWQEGLNP